MDGLLGQISFVLAPLATKQQPGGGRASSVTSAAGDAARTPGQGMAASITTHTPRASAVSPIARDGHGGTLQEEIKDGELCEREDSATYAKRTITEIETCLGFTLHGGTMAAAPLPADSDAISGNELKVLSTQVEAALQSGLAFKDRFRTNSLRQRASHGGDGNGSSPYADGVSEAPSAAVPRIGQAVQELQQQQQNQQQHQQQQQQQELHQQPLVGMGGPSGPPVVAGGAAGGGRGRPPGLGLQLAIGSQQLQAGEWRSGGVWVQKEKAESSAVPSSLQVIPADDLVKVRELGRGCFGSVWLARWRGVEVAFKELLNASPTDTAAAEVFSEAERLAGLRHPCVMAFYGIVTERGAAGTVAEYVCHGSMRSGLQKIKKKGFMDKRLRAHIALQAAYGMEYLHQHYIVHFDLKCDNMLVDLRDLQRPVVKIGDLGLSKTKKGSFVSGNMRGTLPWMAPELFPAMPGASSGAVRREPEDRVTEKVDVFSFGVVLWEIWTLGELPYPNLGLQEIFAGVMTGTLRPTVPQGCDPGWAALMQECWHAVPRMRPSFTDIIARLEAMLARWAVAATAAAGAGASQRGTGAA